MDQNDQNKTKLVDQVWGLHFELSEKYANERTKQHSTAWDASKKNVEKESEETDKKTRSQGLSIPKFKNAIDEDEKNTRFAKSNDLEGCIIDDNTPVTSIECDEPLERVSSWSYTSKNLTVRTVETKKSSHIPYFGEETFDKDKSFVEVLEKTYIVEDVATNEPYITLDEDVFYDMVLSLAQAEREKAKVVPLLAEQPGAEQKLATPGCSSDLVNLVGRLSIDVNKENVLELPPEKIFQMISSTFQVAGSSSHLRTRFIKLCGRRNINLVSPDFTMNVDGNTHVVQTRKKTMGAFARNFCRRCLIYNCLIHIEKTEPVIPKSQVQKNPLPIPKEACSVDCFRNLANIHVHQADDSDTIIDEEPVSEAYKKNWSHGDSNMYGALASVYPGNFCIISEILGKPCKLVYEHSRRGGKHLTKDAYGPGDAPIDAREQTPKKKPVKTKRQRAPAFEATSNAPYTPCYHPGTSCADALDCSCKNSNTYCEKFCNCEDSCKRRFRGCLCKKTCENGLCPCFAAGRECDPDLCEGCGAGKREENQVGTCKNVVIQRQIHKHLLLAKSGIPGAGWGIFAKDNILRNEFIYEYCGEVINAAEADRRSTAYDKRCHTYLFELNGETMIDAKLYGNKMRFANHSNTPNSIPKVMMVNGDHRIGLYAQHDIKAGEEIFINYKSVLENHAANRGNVGGKKSKKVLSKKTVKHVN